MDGTWCLPLLDEATLLSIVEDVWNTQEPLQSPTSLLEEDIHENDTPSTDQETTELTKTKKKRRRDRNRPWHEIARLQAETHKLEQELQQQLTKASKRARYALTNRNMNTKIKAWLRETMEDIHGLEHNLYRQISDLDQTLPGALGTMTRVLPFDVSDDVVFQSLAKSVDEQYADMNRVFRRVGLDGVSSEVNDAFICRVNSVYPQRNDGEMLKFRTQILTPFSSHTLEKSFWQYIELVPSSRSQDPRKLELSLDEASHSVVQKYEIVAGNYTGTRRMVIKQFNEKDRFVQVWSLRTDWKHFGLRHDVKTLENGWGVIQPNGSGSGSVCTGCILMHPIVDGLYSVGNTDLIKSITSMYQHMLVSRVTALENHTMDQVLQERSNCRQNAPA